MEDLHYMEQALQLAAQAAREGEVPVGCVIVRRGQIVGRGRNRRETVKNALSHAEIEAINDACTRLGGWRLWDCTMYVTLEPCPMCAGAIINARIPRVVYGASDRKAGSCGSVCNLFSMAYNHRPQVVSGVCEDEAAALLSEFFSQLRLTLKERPKWRPNRPLISQEEPHELEQNITPSGSHGDPGAASGASAVQLHHGEGL